MVSESFRSAMQPYADAFLAALDGRGELTLPEAITQLESVLFAEARHVLVTAAEADAVMQALRLLPDGHCLGLWLGSDGQVIAEPVPRNITPGEIRRFLDAARDSVS